MRSLPRGLVVVYSDPHWSSYNLGMTYVHASSTRDGPGGSWRPCSQPRSVPKLIPSSVALPTSPSVEARDSCNWRMPLAGQT